MPQTILSIVAIILFSLFAVSQQRRLVFTETAMMRNAVATIANGVAVATLDEASAYPFDDATIEDPVHNASQLTAKADFGDNDPDDLDDWSKLDLDPPGMLAPDTVLFVADTTTHAMVFARTAEVNYVDEFGNASFSPTKYKEIEVTVYSTQVAFADTVRVKRVIACGSRCRF